MPEYDYNFDFGWPVFDLPVLDFDLPVFELPSLDFDLTVFDWEPVFDFSFFNADTPPHKQTTKRGKK
jgi:hypothetical protein